MSVATPLPWRLNSEASSISPFFENAPVGIAQCEAHGAVAAMNSTLERFLGVRHNQNLSFANLVCGGDEREGERLFGQLLAGEQESLQIESHVPSTGMWLRWRAWKVRGRDGQPDSALIMAEDTTAYQNTKQRLRQAERLEAVGRLVSGVAHDFNNLLTGVLLYCDLLLAATKADERTRRYAEEIRSAGMQATGLVRQLLTTARPEHPGPRLLSLNEIAESMRGLLARLIGENIELQFHLDPNLGLVNMDPTHVQQILLNLVLNARDAIAAAGRISIETCNCRLQVLREDLPADRNPATVPCALFVVRDNGQGMSRETQQHVFEAFFTTKQERGTGLGLATVRDIVTSSGGLVHVDSEPGNGTRVAVLLPLAPPAAMPVST